MSTVAKKPPASGRETPTGTPARPTLRGSPASGTGTAAGTPRTRSFRSGTLNSQRGGRRESPLSNGGTPGGSSSNGGIANTSNGDTEADEAARAETVALLDDLRERLTRAEGASESYRRQAETLQVRLDEALREQAKLEERVHEGEEQIEFLTNERRDAARQTREMEAIYEAERSAWQKEKEDLANREEEMQMVIQRLKDSLSQRNNGDDESRPSRQSTTNSPTIDSGSFAPPSSIQRSDSRNNSKLLLQKDKLIESLRLEVAEAQIKLVESENQGGGRLQEVERLLMEARMANARLMEDNESYQLLLQEKTLKGDFGTSDFSYMSSATNHDALAALEGRSSSGDAGAGAGAGTSLADELNEAGDGGESDVHEVDHETVRRLEAEVKAAKDQNKALTLYINKIIERLLQHQDFEHILDQTNDFKSPGSGGPNTNKDLPPPPPKQTASGASLLQRAKSIATGGGPAKVRPRPMTFMPSTTNSAVTNPETAPSIPIGLTRSASTARRGRPMSEQLTGAGSAGAIVNAMYKGSGSEAGGPLSPTLRSSQQFFNPVQPNRHSSGGSNLPLSTSGNFPGMRSETSSTSGEDLSGAGADTATLSTTSQSPPRSHHSEGATKFAGNKPRPLRLVQENPDSVAAAQANKRQSWMGWASSAFTAKKDDEPIRE